MEHKPGQVHPWAAGGRQSRRATPLDDAFQRWLAARLRRIFGEAEKGRLPDDLADLAARFAEPRRSR